MDHYKILLPDLYHLLMAQGFFLENNFKQVAFELFFRKAPFIGGFTVFAGLEPLMRHILASQFPDKIIVFLKNTGRFRKKFLDYLKELKFTGDIFATKEGEFVFPYETLLRVEANIIEAHLLEALILNYINFQSLIATKAARIKNATGKASFFDFGLRRASGIDGAFSATRAAFIGGSSGTSNVIAGAELEIPVIGSMSHSWVMSYDSEKEAFIRFGTIYPENVIFLVDTYDTLNQGIPNAIAAFHFLAKEKIVDKGAIQAIRIDSGDLDFLAKKARKMLDKAGLQNVKIMLSNEIDEDTIESFNLSHTPVDFFGIGTKLINGFGGDSLGAVYKLVSTLNNQNLWEPKIKLAENIKKTTIPAKKNTIRFYDIAGEAIGDLILLQEECENYQHKIAKREPIFFYDPLNPLIYEKMIDYDQGQFLLHFVVKNGHQVENALTQNLSEIQKYQQSREKSFSARYKRRLNPQLYLVGFSKALSQLRTHMINQAKKN